MAASVPDNAAAASLQLSSNLAQLARAPSADRCQVLVEEIEVLAEFGLSEPQLHSFFDILLDVSDKYSVTTAQKRYIIKNVLVPDRMYVLQPSLLHKILSNVGFPRVYFDNGRKRKASKIARSVQTALLDWLISSIHLFGDSVFFALVSVLPILLNLLSFEYSRLQIVNIIFLTLLNGHTASGNRQLVKRWHIELVVGLYNKFPADEGLRSLIILFKYLVPDLDYSKFHSVHPLDTLSEFSSKLRYPNLNYLKKLSELKSHQEHNTLITKTDNLVDTFLTQYRQFNSYKRRRVHVHSEIDNLDMIQLRHSASIKKSIYDIHSLPALVAQLDNVQYLQITNFFATNYTNKFELNFLVLKHLLNHNDVSFRKIDLYLRVHFEDKSILFSELETICDNCIKLLNLDAAFIHMSSLIDFMNFGISTRFDQLRVLKLRLRFLKFYPANLSKFQTCLTRITSLLGSRVSKNALPIREAFNELFVGLHDMFCRWLDHSKASLSSISAILVEVYDFVQGHLHEFTILTKLNFIKILRFVCDLDTAEFTAHFTPNAVLLPPAVIYGLLLTINPLVVSEACRYLAYTKNFSFDQQHKALQNCYIMDILNFLWRDKAFYVEEDSTNRGMMFHPDFLAKLPVLNVFGYTGLVKIQTIGNLFHHPAWSYIITHLVWDMENEAPDITRRHPGPVTEESVAAILSDSSQNWLNLAYPELKLKILQRLDAMGYTGLGDLLFKSLRSLANAREPQN